MARGFHCINPTFILVSRFSPPLVLRGNWRALGGAVLTGRVSLANSVGDPVINLGFQPADTIRAELNPPRETAGGFHAVDMIPGITDAA